VEQMEAVLATLQRGGLRPEEATRTFHGLIAFTIGAAALFGAAGTQTASLGKDPASWKAAVRSRLGDGGSKSFPHVLRAAPHLASFASRKSFLAELEARVRSIPFR